MSDTAHIVDLIERASTARPWCDCGSHTTAVWRDGIVWLECASLRQPRRGLIARFTAALSTPAHVEVPIVEGVAAA
jgi:hypothetical protein